VGSVESIRTHLEMKYTYPPCPRHKLHQIDAPQFHPKIFSELFTFSDDLFQYSSSCELSPLCPRCISIEQKIAVEKEINLGKSQLQHMLNAHLQIRNCYNTKVFFTMLKEPLLPAPPL
jgi:hypothetical protein